MINQEKLESWSFCKLSDSKLEEIKNNIWNKIDFLLKTYWEDNDLLLEIRKNQDLAIQIEENFYSYVITNPPYGERLEEKEDLPALYQLIGQGYKGLDSWSMYIVTSYEDAEKYIGRKADKNRKLYNGMIKAYFYQFMGPRPPKRKPDNK